MSATSNPAHPPRIDDPAHIAPGSDNVHEAIRDILADEYPDLAAQHGDKVGREPFLALGASTVIRYLKFIFKTWAAVASSFVRMLAFEMSTPPFLHAAPLVLTPTHVSRPVQLLGALGLLYSDHSSPHCRSHCLSSRQSPLHPSRV